MRYHYRGKRKDNGEWVYGAVFVLHHNDDRKHLHYFIIPDNIPIPRDKTIGEIQVEVIPETIGVYVVEENFYQGDILQGSNSNGLWWGVVEYSTEHRRLMIHEVYACELFEIDNFSYDKVVGNIHDNPDFFKEQ